MILLEPANKITHCNVEIKRRTISLTGFAATSTTRAPDQFRTCRKATTQALSCVIERLGHDSRLDDAQIRLPKCNQSVIHDPPASLLPSPCYCGSTPHLAHAPPTNSCSAIPSRATPTLLPHRGQEPLHDTPLFLLVSRVATRIQPRPRSACPADHSHPGRPAHHPGRHQCGQ